MASVFRWFFVIGAVLLKAQCFTPKFRILGGYTTPEGGAPYHVAVMSEFDAHGMQICGGTVVSPRWVLTARHCVGPLWKDFDNFTAVSIFIKAGARKLFTDGELYFAEKAVMHVNRKPSPHDIAMVKTVNAIKYNKVVQPALLPGDDIGAGVRGVLSGWGSTELGGNMSDVLQSIRLTTLDLRECARHILVSYNHLCIKPVAGEGACKGDSGGGLVVNKEVVAIVSYVVAVENKCGQGKPDVFTRVYPYLGWIKRVMETQ